MSKYFFPFSGITFFSLFWFTMNQKKNKITSKVIYTGNPLTMTPPWLKEQQVLVLLDVGTHFSPKLHVPILSSGSQSTAHFQKNNFQKTIHFFASES